MRVADSGHIVWDEVVAFWLVLWLAMPMGFWGQLVAFVLFRFFDAVKFGPMGWADGLFKGFGWRGGLGILLGRLCGSLLHAAGHCTLEVLMTTASLSKNELLALDQQALDANLTQISLQLLKRRHRLATAESCTGGMIAAACTDLSGCQRLV